MTDTKQARAGRSRRLRHRGLSLAVALLAAACGAISTSGAPGQQDEQEAQLAQQITGEWPHLGFDVANTRAQVDETTVGTDNVADLGRVWELADVAGVSGTPIVRDGVLYVGDWTGNLRALDAATGEEAWSADLGDQVPGAVAVDDTRVFAGTWGGNLVARNRETGAEEWSVRVDEHEVAAIYGEPVVVDGMVLLPVSSDEWWEGPEGHTFRGSFVAFDAATGDEVWRYWTTCGPENAGQDNCPQDAAEGSGVGIWRPPAVDTERGVVYFGTGNHYAAPASGRSDALVAVDLATGEEQWVHQFTPGDIWNIPGQGDPDFEVGPDSDVGGPSLFQVDGVDAVGVGDKAGTYKAINRDTGEELWSQDLTDGSIQGGIMGSGAVVDGTIYLTSNRGGTNADLISLDANTGEEVWRVDVGGQVVSPTTWANGVLYLADNTGRFNAFDASNGERLWSWDVENQAAGGMSVVDGMVFGGWGWALQGDSPAGGLMAFGLGGEPPDDGDPGEVDGAQVFGANCALCHGTDGSGASGPSLQGIGDGHSREEVMETVRNGRPPEMPAWEGVISDEEINSVVDYIMTLEGDGHDHDHDDDHDHGEPTTTTTEHDDDHDHGEPTTTTTEHDDDHDHGEPTTTTTEHDDDHGEPTTTTTEHDDDHGEPTTTTTAPPGDGECITASNSEHRDAGRAEGFLFVNAVGSGESLGLWLSTTSLQETSPGNWSRVDGCPGDPASCSWIDQLLGRCPAPATDPAAAG